MDAVTGTTTAAVSGLSFNVPVHGLAVAYVGGAREFIVALQDRLLEIDAGGAQRVLTTRAPGGLASQASVAARDDVVFYAASLAAPVLYRVRLTDPARTVESMSLASGGDVRFFPQAPLSGVTFADPRGLAFGARRHALRRRSRPQHGLRGEPGRAPATSWGEPCRAGRWATVRAATSRRSASVNPACGSRCASRSA